MPVLRSSNELDEPQGRRNCSGFSIETDPAIRSYLLEINSRLFSTSYHPQTSPLSLINCSLLGTDPFYKLRPLKRPRPKSMGMGPTNNGALYRPTTKLLFMYLFLYGCLLVAGLSICLELPMYLFSQPHCVCPYVNLSYKFRWNCLIFTKYKCVVFVDWKLKINNSRNIFFMVSWFCWLWGKRFYGIKVIISLL